MKKEDVPERVEVPRVSVVIKIKPKLLDTLIPDHKSYVGMRVMERHLAAANVLSSFYEEVVQVFPYVFRSTNERCLLIIGERLENFPLSSHVPEQFLGFRVEEEDTYDKPGKERGLKKRLKEGVSISKQGRWEKDEGVTKFFEKKEGLRMIEEGLRSVWFLVS